MWISEFICEIIPHNMESERFLNRNVKNVVFLLLNEKTNGNISSLHHRGMFPRSKLYSRKNVIWLVLLETVFLNPPFW